jgi:ATP-binding cassette subfamily B protein
MKRYAMSRAGAKGFVNAVCACVVSDIVLMLPVSLLYFFTGDMLENTIDNGKIIFYIFGIVISLLLIYVTQFWQYNATYYSTYRESAVRRITLAESLRKLPLSFFGILLDEATASLDAENETLIQQSISRLIKNKTVMIIAHRMRTVAGADKIVVIKDGRADEQGAPEELEKQNGIYAKMLALQK